MSYALGSGSLVRLGGVHPDLVMVVKAAITISSVDFAVSCGLRTEQEQAAILAQGNSRTMRSLHLRQPDGFAHAVDLVPYLGAGMSPFPQPKESRDTYIRKIAAFQAVSDAMFTAADSLKLLIQWGADWDQDGVRDDRQKFVGKRPLFDMPHFQMPQPWNVELAKRAQELRCATRGKL